MRNENFVKTFYSEGTVGKHRIVKFGAADNGIVQSAAAADAHIGVSDGIGSLTGEAQDVIMDGVALVVYGGPVTRGEPLTADAEGKAIVATLTGQAIIGRAMQSGVAGDIGSVRINPGFLAVAA